MTWDDDIKGWLIKSTDQWLVHVVPMIYNHRITLTAPAEYPYFWTAGWCYDTREAAVLAAAVFDPETQMDPAGFKKLADDQRRTARQRAEVNQSVAGYI